MMEAQREAMRRIETLIVAPIKIDKVAFRLCVIAEQQVWKARVISFGLTLGLAYFCVKSDDHPQPVLERADVYV